MSDSARIVLFLFGSGLLMGVWIGALVIRTYTEKKLRQLRSAQELLKAYEIAHTFETPRPAPLAFIFGDMRKALFGKEGKR